MSRNTIIVQFCNTPEHSTSSLKERNILRVISPTYRNVLNYFGPLHKALKY
jgi:hypothetical protein